MKNLVVFAALCFGAFLLGCSENSVQPEPESEVSADTLSTLFFLEGKKIETRYSEWPVPDGEQPSVDTTNIYFTVHIKRVEGDMKKVRFYGLEGADAGSAGNRVYPNCTVSDDCKVYGNIVLGQQFEIDLENNGRTYQANGLVTTFEANLTGRYQYQNLTIDYELQGERYYEDKHF